MDPIVVARQAVADERGCPVTELVAEDKTHLYPWVERHTLVWVTGPALKRAVCPVTIDGEAALCLGERGHERLVTLLRKEGVPPPDGLPPDELARVTRDLLRGPGGLVGTQQAVARERRGVASWVRPEAFDTDRKVWERHFRDPTLGHTDRGWLLRFSYFARDGGVESWEVSGDTDRVTAVKVEQAVGKGRFRFPYM